MNVSNQHLDLARILGRASLPMTRFHDLRHITASLLYNRSILVIVVSKTVVHVKTSITHGYLWVFLKLDAGRNGAVE